jgi:uroporphyrinogen-III decarboxylase
VVRAQLFANPHNHSYLVAGPAPRGVGSFLAGIAGGISASLLATGTVDNVKARCKRLIDTVGKNGAYIMSHGCQMDDLRPGNMKAMIDFTAEYGIYR